MDSPRDSHLPTADWYSIDGWGSRSRKGIRLRPRRSGTAPGADACAWSVILAPLQQIFQWRIGPRRAPSVHQADYCLSSAERSTMENEHRLDSLYSSSSGTGAHDLSGLKRSIFTNSARLVGPKSFW